VVSVEGFPGGSHTPGWCETRWEWQAGGEGSYWGIGPSGQGGGGGGGSWRGGTRQSQDYQSREVTEADCEKIRAILNVEKRLGNFAAAKFGIENYFVSKYFTNNTANNYGNLFPTSRGPIDLDWYGTLVLRGVANTPMFGVSNVLGHAVYVFGKTVWEMRNLFIPSSREGNGPYLLEGPYRDPGERVAANAYANGITFSDLFDQKWFDTHCDGKR
jgi:hypothetical protein